MNQTIRTIVVIVAICITAGNAYAHQDSHDQMRRVESMLAVSPTDAHLHFRYGELLAMHGDYDQATESFDRALAFDPQMTKVYLAKTEFFLKQGKPQQALTSIATYARHHPKDLNVFRYRAKAYAAAMKFDVAIENYRLLCQMQSHPRPETYIAIADIRILQGKSDLAIQELQSAIERLGPLVALREKIVGVQLARGKFDAAIDQLQSLLASSGRKEILLFRIAEIMELAGQQDAAADHYRQSSHHLQKLPTKYRRSRRIQMLEQSLATKLTASH